jgi:hypothetical protein
MTTKFDQLINCIENGIDDNSGDDINSILSQKDEEISVLKDEIEELKEEVEELEVATQLSIKTGRDVISFTMKDGNLLDTQILESFKEVVETKNSFKLLQLLQKLSKSDVLN